MLHKLHVNAVLQEMLQEMLHGLHVRAMLQAMLHELHQEMLQAMLEQSVRYNI